MLKSILEFVFGQKKQDQPSTYCLCNIVIRDLTVPGYQFDRERDYLISISDGLINSEIKTIKVKFKKFYTINNSVEDRTIGILWEVDPSTPTKGKFLNIEFKKDSQTIQGDYCQFFNNYLSCIKGMYLVHNIQ
jgi:hypothetical protein